MAAILGEAWPELFAAVGVHSGLAPGAANDVLSAFSAMRGQGGLPPRRGPRRGDGPRLIVIHGDADATVHPVNAERLVAGTGRDALLRAERPAAADGRRGYVRRVSGEAGARALECWMIDGAPHAWAGGDPGGSYTDPLGPDASGAMVRFFLDGASDAPPPPAV
jgi:poly(3-hydroxybutyrate) depolymerase